MQVRPTRVAALMAVLVLGFTALVVAMAPAGAASAPSVASGETCERPPASQEDAIHVIGCLTYNREKPPAPVEGVEVSVEDESGNSVGEATSDATGIFDIALPGTSVDNLGASYTIKIDTETLPDKTSLVDEKKTSLTVQITTDADIFVTFPIGEERAAGAGKAVQVIQLAVGGITFSLLLALAALGLSLVFGTTELTNFAHGELVTFGALAALAVDRLPGEIRIGGANVTFITAVIVAFIVSGAFGWAQDKGL
jgi:branched-chain amino acid transport system permease protein